MTLIVCRYQNVIHWNLVLRDEETARKWHENMLNIVRTCVGKDSLIYREMQQDATGADAIGLEKTAAVFTETSLDGHDKVEMADEPEFEDEHEEMIESGAEESNEEENNHKDDEYIE